MKQKIFLTSVIAMGLVAPAMADPERLSTFPNASNNEFMQENKIYTDAATETNMAGVYEGEVNAVAQYENILYTIGAGQYLPAGGESVINCDQSGYFCPGLQSQVQYDAQNAQGLTSCSTATNGTYTLSDGTGSTADSCYRQCSGNVTIAHATGVTGNDYYGNGVDTCEPTECEHGWHMKEGTTELQRLIGTREALSAGFLLNQYGNITWDEYRGGRGKSYYNISNSEKNSFGVDFYKDVVIDWDAGKEIFYTTIAHGHGVCSKKQGTASNSTYSIETSVSDQTFQSGATYCWCNIDSYKPSDGNWQSVVSSFVFLKNTGDEESCPSTCPMDCALSLSGGNSAFRSTLLGTIGQRTPTICDANTITINWDGASATEINANNAGTATYGSDIRTPRSATPVPGKTFTGWRFVAPQQVSSGL